MKMLTSEVTNLLDKLYNLRGEDSVVLTKMEKERQAAEETKSRTAAEKTALQDKIESLTEEERLLAEEGEKLLSVLSKIRTDDFKIVLERLNIDFNPDKLTSDVNNLLPQTVKKVQDETNKAKDELVKVDSEMNTATATIEELAIRKDEAIANQTRLNEYFELALNGNINITRDSITSLLQKFDFSEDEQREAAKILMFPEDALYEYEKKQNSEMNPGKTISEVFQEAKDVVEELNTPEIEPVVEPIIEPAIVEEIKNELSPRESLIELLKELGFDYLDFTSSDLDKVVANYNENIVRKNVQYVKDKGLRLDFFTDNSELLYDRDLENKVDKLIEIGKEPFDIYLNSNVLTKYSINDLNTTITNLKNSGLDPKIVPLMAY